MPRGTRHVETGILRPGKWGYSLEVDGGGVWQLDVARSAAKRLCNQRVTVEGTRSGFDLLEVDRITRVGQATANQQDRMHPFAMIRVGWAMALRVPMNG